MELLQPTLVGMLIVWPYLRLARSDKWQQFVALANIWGAFVFLTWAGIVQALVNIDPSLLVIIPATMWIVGAITANGMHVARISNKTSRR